jgi:DNA polymerase III, epsilon subunit and related 3''-5'' exonucleases
MTMKDKILFIDTETGGLDSSIHQLLSIGLVVWCDNQILDACEIPIHDKSLQVDISAIKVNKIDIVSHMKIAFTPAYAFEMLDDFLYRNFIDYDKIILGGHNVSFDVNFLKSFYKRLNKNYNARFSHRLIDTSSILHFLYYTDIIKEKVISSQQAFDFFNINVKDRHTALADAMATAILFSKLIKLTTTYNSKIT